MAAQRMVGLSLSVSEKAKMTLDRQARQRGLHSSQWAGQIFDMGSAAVCARDKSMPVLDKDLDAIVGATLLLLEAKKWDTATIAKGLGVPEPVVVKILTGWRDYRRMAS
ncbi:hypothetical protein LAV84_06825 [Rhizobium sp. VS19-DR104.2]|uniref:hypothetical protein n=1 Tax=unclassified Rhizobium TaxID=2613769 RepID=UPI001CC40B87|nr:MULTISPECIES: hypothetical protein [unclassified Rhizobium]MBZ5760260.1 hypothetical protein [Rhizobium sp. VS19-DR96]MBZ5766896.1 hypothetical protein [Rhizobium sp. VS19-DR129.2]MBZ5773111.1 hypothetical protein [Rhizobium sp. VS19-DRK62.2]MBZ5784095.1 hypothetical protein [Rhizobium sp. VS19-DR121]MBZ5802455.1 hypothetical protein [Rhizobium sp. VS19-DR181]